jgi:D-inositol-3-phosphate glycosyltransferase
VDTGLFHPGDKDAVRGSVGFEGDAAQVVFVGALDDNKGLGCEDLIGALSMLPSDDARLTVVGDGPLAERLKSLAAELGVASRVTFEHAAPSARVAELLRAADVVAVVPRKRESLGLIALEARASHTPVVAYNVGGLPEHVVPGVNGELVDPGDRKGLAAAIVTALKRSKSGEYRYDSPPVLDTEAAGALLASVTMELLADR